MLDPARLVFIDETAVSIRNQSDGDEFVKVRGEFFKSKFPASMLITAKDFANPDLLVEILSVAVIGDQLK
jgi:enamine deaminase RidA (YjgF/YER057c/UK114 family)